MVTEFFDTKKAIKSYNNLKLLVFQFSPISSENPRAGSSSLSFGTIIKSSRDNPLELFVFEFRFVENGLRKISLNETIPF